ncbi:hypothetical protein TNCT_352551 [Trichonephila clavata]|uniref:Uncharacterized protein n=1 Tax=Trichonephila clavata TaxID=2740835 RepID=A0A8X6GGH1_TRICU|nr:hypothetical protein TNCT_352551 [Trichonephila clavata]
MLDDGTHTHTLATRLLRHLIPPLQVQVFFSSMEPIDICLALEPMTDDLNHIWAILVSTRNRISLNSVNRLEISGQAYLDEKSVANVHAAFYKSSSRFNFSFVNNSILKRTGNVIHTCLKHGLENRKEFKSFSSQQFFLALILLDLKLFSELDGIFVQTHGNLSFRRKQREISITNLS